MKVEKDPSECNWLINNWLSARVYWLVWAQPVSIFVRQKGLDTGRSESTPSEQAWFISSGKNSTWNDATSERVCTQMCPPSRTTVLRGKRFVFSVDHPTYYSSRKKRAPSEFCAKKWVGNPPTLEKLPVLLLLVTPLSEGELTGQSVKAPSWNPQWSKIIIVIHHGYIMIPMSSFPVMSFGVNDHYTTILFGVSHLL